jgi:hypothetical protein
MKIKIRKMIKSKSKIKSYCLACTGRIGQVDPTLALNLARNPLPNLNPHLTLSLFCSLR